MKASSILKTLFIAMPLCFAACKSHKSAVEETPTAKQTQETEDKAHFLDRVQDNSQTVRFVNGKIKFTIEVGQQNIGLTGNLKMKRDDVIRLQLMAFGFVEAGRVEFTKDYVLIMDRINKQYLKAPYMQVDFLRNSGLNFYTLQALFWNELFLPNQVKMDSVALRKYITTESGEDVVISNEDGKMNYSWLANSKTALIQMANILYKDKYNGNTELNWDYSQFKKFEGFKTFPAKSAITLTTPKKTVKLNMTLNYINQDSEWEDRTEISNKYREVTVDEILRRFMSL